MPAAFQALCSIQHQELGKASHLQGMRKLLALMHEHHCVCQLAHSQELLASSTTLARNKGPHTAPRLLSSSDVMRFCLHLAGCCWNDQKCLQPRQHAPHSQSGIAPLCAESFLVFGSAQQAPGMFQRLRQCLRARAHGGAFRFVRADAFLSRWQQAAWSMKACPGVLFTDNGQTFECRVYGHAANAAADTASQRQQGC